MPAAPYTDMTHYSQFLRATPEERILPEEAEALKAANDIDGMFTSVAKLVPYIVQKYIHDAHNQECYSDLIQAGNMGVLTAAESWVPGPSKMAWPSWAYMYIRKAVVREMQKELKYRANNVSADFSHDHYYEDDPRAVATEIFVDGEWAMSDVASDGGAGDAARDATLELEQMRDQLDEREQAHLDMLLEGHTQQYMAAELGVSQSRVSRLTTKLFAKCREFSEA